jgi:hypothetical protein
VSEDEDNSCITGPPCVCVGGPFYFMRRFPPVFALVSIGVPGGTYLFRDLVPKRFSDAHRDLKERPILECGGCDAALDPPANVAQPPSAVFGAPDNALTAEGGCATRKRGRRTPKFGSYDSAFALLRVEYIAWTIHPSPFTLHPSPFTLHPSSFTLHPYLDISSPLRYKVYRLSRENRCSARRPNTHCRR